MSLMPRPLGEAMRSPVSLSSAFVGHVLAASLSACAAASSTAMGSSLSPGLCLAMVPPFVPPPDLPSRSDPARSDERDDAEQGIRSKLKLQHALSLASVVALIPGLTLTLFTAKAVEELSFGPLGTFRIPLLVFSKSTLGTVHHLASGHYFLPAGLIVLFSVAIPAGKAVVMAIAASSAQNQGSDQQHRGLIVVRRMAKWAHVDAICAATLAGGLGNILPQLTVGLRAGFYCFVSYCTLSTCAAVAATSEHRQLAAGVEVQRQLTPSIDAPTASEIDLRSALLDLGSCIAAAAVVLKTVTTPMLSFSVPALWIQSHHLTVIEMISRLFDGGESAASVYLSLGLCALPMVDLAAASLRLRSRGPIAEMAHHRFAKALGEFALLDVCLASLVVTRLATGGLSNGIVVSLAPDGLYWLIGYAALRLALELAAPELQSQHAVGMPGMTQTAEADSR